MGRSHNNPLLNKCVYEVQLLDGINKSYIYNVIYYSIYDEVNDEEN